MDTTQQIVATEAEYSALLLDPRRSLSRFVEVSLAYGRMLSDLDPQHAAEVLTLALETLHDPPAPAEVDVTLELIGALGAVAERVRWSEAELDAIGRHRSLMDAQLIDAGPGEREALCRRAASVQFESGQVADGFAELMVGLERCEGAGLDELATDLVLAVRRRHVPAAMMNELEDLWVRLRRDRVEGTWPLWCLTALGAIRLDAGDVVTAQMYVRRAETSLGHLQRPVAHALVAGWVALAAEDFSRAHERFQFASSVTGSDERTRLLAVAGLGEALICLGRNDEARAPLAEAISYDVGDPASLARAHELLAELADFDDRSSEAYSHLKQARHFEQLARGVKPRPARVNVADHDDADLTAEVAAKLVAELAESDADPVARPHVGLSDTADTAQTANTDMDDTEAVIELVADADLLDEPVVDLRASAAGHTEAEVADATRQLHHFVAESELSLCFELVHDNSTGRAGAARAVLSVADGYGRPVGIGNLVAMVDDTDLAESVASWLLSGVCSVLAECARTGHRLVIGIDVSAAQLTARLGSLVARATTDAGVEPDLLMIDVAGDVAAELNDAQLAVLDHLRRLGVRLGLSGVHPGLRHGDALRRIAPDAVSFHSSAFAPIGRDESRVASSAARHRQFVEELVASADELGYDVIATEVGTNEEFAWQREAGCHGACGPLLGELVAQSTFFSSVADIDSVA